jgi:hypothetical protein
MATTPRSEPNQTALERMGLTSTALALLPLAIAINIAIGQIATGLPVYLDSIGTVLVGALLGPWMGLLTGVLSNVIWTLLGNPIPIYFAYVAGVIGLIAGFAGRAGAFTRPSPRWVSALVGAVFLFALTLFLLMFLNRNPDPNAYPPFPTAAELLQRFWYAFLIAAVAGGVAGYFVFQRGGYAGLVGLITGIVAAVLSAPMSAYVFGGVTGAGTDLLVGAFRASGGSILESTFAQGTVSDPFDKMTSFLIVWLIIQSLPKRLIRRFPNTRNGQSAP